jgi:hypothetical protein
MKTVFIIEGLAEEMIFENCFRGRFLHLFAYRGVQEISSLFSCLSSSFLMISSFPKSNFFVP